MISDINLWAEATSVRGLLGSHAEALQNLISALDLAAIEQVAELLDARCRQGNTVYCAGNGGSAATASHIAADLAWGRRMSNEPRPRALSLVSNVALMSALANDAGYENVFVEQLKGPFQEGDIVIAISASGNSENVLRAARFANENGGASVGLVGFDGGKLKGLSQVCIDVPTPVGAYELVEDVHHAVCHMLANCLKYMAERRSGTSGQ
jgi:D-sedoheptulose 7-phosphate isomerase